LRQLAPGVWRLDEFPRPMINVYLSTRWKGDDLCPRPRIQWRNFSLILPGHGPAVTDIAAFERFVAALPT
jgi:hypothetical protein